MPHLLAIDQGTTSTRAIVYDDAAKIRGQAARELTQHYPRPGWVEHDPEEIWASVRMLVKQALDAAAGSGDPRRTGVAAVGLTNQRETVVVWEKATGRPVAPAIVWQDRRTSDFCRQRQADEPWIRERTGLVLDPYFSATKVRWLLKQDAALRRQAQYAQFECEFEYKGQPHPQHRDHLATCTCLLGSSKPRHTLRPFPNETLAGHGWYRPVS